MEIGEARDLTVVEVDFAGVFLEMGTLRQIEVKGQGYKLTIKSTSGGATDSRPIRTSSGLTRVITLSTRAEPLTV